MNGSPSHSLLLDGNCANLAFLYASGALPHAPSDRLASLLSGYASKHAVVSFGQSNVMKALGGLGINCVYWNGGGIADYCTPDERITMEETLSRAASHPRIVAACLDYNRERGQAQKSSELVVREIMTLLLLARWLEADTWMWKPRRTIALHLLESVGARTQTRHRADTIVYESQVASFPTLFRPPMEGKAHVVKLLGEPSIESHFFGGDAKSPPKILFVASAPRNASATRFDIELRQIEALRGTTTPGVQVTHMLAARVRDLEAALQRNEPSIVYFAGHATPAGMVLENDAGHAAVLSYEAFAAILEAAGSVHCVILNACHTHKAAAILLSVARMVVGVPGEWPDDAAVEFSDALWGTLARGHSVEKAFRVARGRVMGMGIVGLHELPVLECKQ
jgi:hypothetical protein